MPLACAAFGCTNRETLKNRNHGITFINAFGLSGSPPLNLNENDSKVFVKKLVLLTGTQMSWYHYEETDKPNNAVEFIKHRLGVVGSQQADPETLHMEFAEQQQICKFPLENKQLRNRLLQYEPMPEEGTAE